MAVSDEQVRRRIAWRGLTLFAGLVLAGLIWSFLDDADRPTRTSGAGFAVLAGLGLVVVVELLLSLVPGLGQAPLLVTRAEDGGRLLRAVNG